MMNDLTGQKFGRLTVAWPVGQNQSRHIMWLCFCSCGKFKVVSGRNLVSGNTKSCGCLILKHGYARGHIKTPEYKTYYDAKARCTNPRHISYPNYGGRGIEFKFDSFEQFLAEVGPKPEGEYPSGHPLYSIDRIENNGHYEIGNVKWSTQSEQHYNRRPRRAA